MLCVDLSEAGTMERVRNFKTEVRQVCPKSPILLVGTKKDKPMQITEQQLREKVSAEGLQGQCMTSSKQYQDENVNKAFQYAIRLGYYFKYPQDLK